MIVTETRRQFKMCVKGPDNSIVGVGIGSTKKQGEQNAAEQALLYFGELRLNDESDEETIIVSSDEEVVEIIDDTDDD